MTIMIQQLFQRQCRKTKKPDHNENPHRYQDHEAWIGAKKKNNKNNKNKQEREHGYKQEHVLQQEQSLE